MLEIEYLTRDAIENHQWLKLRSLLKHTLDRSAFYRTKFAEVGLLNIEDAKDLNSIRSLPFTTKTELATDHIANPPFGSGLTYPLDEYIHWHQTSGSHGQPMTWLDTKESWDWWIRCWNSVLLAAEVSSTDRVFFPFSFGPFIGFWSAWAATEHLGALVMSGANQSSLQRLRNIISFEATVLCCTPSYALRLASVAETEGMHLASSPVKKIIVAGEPGGNIPNTKTRIEELWGARVLDHAGATEVGAYGFSCLHDTFMHLNESEFLIEVIDPQTTNPSNKGELVITNMGRLGSPVIRYRTGDIVELDDATCKCGRAYKRVKNGIIGRVDEMVIIRGVNIFPSCIEQVVRQFDGIKDFFIEAYTEDNQSALRVRVELFGKELKHALESELHNRFGLRMPVIAVHENHFKELDHKSSRFKDLRKHQ